MTINAKKVPNNSKFERAEPLEPGTYPARLVWVVGLGLQEQKPYQGKEKPPVHMLHVKYELLDEFMVDKETGEELKDRPRWISESFPLHSLESDRAKSTQRMTALDPGLECDGDWSKLIGTPCMVTLVINKKGDKVYENVASVSSMRAKEASKAPELVNDSVVFDPDEPDLELFLSFPEWLQDKIKENLEFEGGLLERMLEDHKGSSKGGSTKKESEAPQNEEEGVSDPSEDEDSGDEEDW